jgi:hypothetical protein
MHSCSTNAAVEVDPSTALRSGRDDKGLFVDVKLRFFKFALCYEIRDRVSSSRHATEFPTGAKRSERSGGTCRLAAGTMRKLFVTAAVGCIPA